MERTDANAGSLHFAIGSHWGVDVEVFVATLGMEAGFTSPHSFPPSNLVHVVTFHAIGQHLNKYLVSCQIHYLHQTHSFFYVLNKTSVIALVGFLLLITILIIFVVTHVFFVLVLY